MYTPGHLKSNLLPATITRVKRYTSKSNYTDRSLRDPRYLMSVLKRLPQADKYLFGLFQTRKLAILGFDWDIKFPDEFETTDTEKEQIQKIKTRFRQTKIFKLGENIINGRLFGMSCTELGWKNVPGLGTSVVNFKEYDLTELDVDPDSNDLLYINSYDDGYEFDFEELDPKDKYIMVNYNPFRGIDSNYIGGVARINMLYVLLKYWDFHNWSKNNEKYADPMIYAQYRAGTDKKKVRELLDQLEKLGANSRAAFSDNTKIELMEAMRKSSAEAHQALINQINKEMAISILGQQLTTEVGKVGSFAAAKIANYVRQDYLAADLSAVEDGFNQYLKVDYDLNFGEPRNGYPIFKFDLNEKEDYESNARILSEINLMRQSKEDLPLAKDEVYEKIGFREPADDEETI